MKPTELVLRCYAVRRGDVWSAVCVDLSLAAQGATFDEAKRRLGDQIEEYVYEAMTIDKDHAAELLSRKAPMSQRLVWHGLQLLAKVHEFARAKEFRQALPVVPGCA